MYVKFCNHINKTLVIIEILVMIILGHPVVINFRTLKSIHILFIFIKEKQLIVWFNFEKLSGLHRCTFVQITLTFTP